MPSWERDGVKAGKGRSSKKRRVGKAKSGWMRPADEANSDTPSEQPGKSEEAGPKGRSRQRKV